MSQSSVAVVRGLYEAFERADIPALLAALDEDIEWHAPYNLPHGGDFRGREAVGRFFQGIGEAWEELSVEVEEIIGDGEHVVAVARATGRLRGTGEETGYGAAHVWTLRDGTPTRFSEYVDAPLTLPAAHTATA